jgi:hypothetical protein
MVMLSHCTPFRAERPDTPPYDDSVPFGDRKAAGTVRHSDGTEKDKAFLNVSSSDRKL